MTQAILLVACALLAGAVLGLAVALRGLRQRLATLEASAVSSPGFVTGASAPSSTIGRAPSSTSGRTEAADRVADEEEYVITRLGEGPDEPGPTVEPKLFADLVLRESVVRAASFAYGVRRGLSPANRNRIRFEMRREVKRARKARRAEEREALREWRARQRATLREDAA